jgi:hypothetical protein
VGAFISANKAIAAKSNALSAKADKNCAER